MVVLWISSSCCSDSGTSILPQTILWSEKSYLSNLVSIMYRLESNNNNSVYSLNFVVCSFLILCTILCLNICWDITAMNFFSILTNGFMIYPLGRSNMVNSLWLYVYFRFVELLIFMPMIPFCFFLTETPKIKCQRYVLSISDSEINSLDFITNNPICQNEFTCLYKMFVVV